MRRRCAAADAPGMEIRTVAEPDLQFMTMDRGGGDLVTDRTPDMQYVTRSPRR
jgi:hypothetical protein